MSDTQHNQNSRQLVAAALVAAVVASFFGFTAGFLAGDTRLGGAMLEQISPGLYRSLGYADESDRREEQAETRLREALGEFKTEEERRISLVEKATPAVVSIVAEKDVPVFERTYTDPFGGNDFFRQFFGDIPGFGVPQMQQKGTERRETGAGTGFFVSPDGLIVTNKHVVADEEADYTVITSDGEKHAASVLGRDPANDLAVIRVEPADGEDPQEFPFVPLADGAPMVGQSVVAVGYALGQFSNTVSSGIVSGLSRSIRASDPTGQNAEDLYGVIQTDAAINPGNSGGPLLNLDGEAIGINVATVQGSENIGFALPASDVRHVIDSVESTGHISRPFIGVRYVMIDDKLAEANQLPVDHGALVVRGDLQTDLAVTPGSPADIAGIVENDIILEVEGERLDEDNPLALAIRKYDAGDTVTFRVYHKGEEMEVDVTLVERK